MKTKNNKFLLFVLIGCLVSNFFSLEKCEAESPYHDFIVKLKNNQERLTFNQIQTILPSEKWLYSKIKNYEAIPTSFGLFARITMDPQINLKYLELQLHLQKKSQIEYITPNYIIHIKNETPLSEETDPIVTDPNFNEQWALKNTKNIGFPDLGVGLDINALNAWKITKGNKQNPLKIGVIDTGIDYKHAELIEQMDVNFAEFKGQPEVDDDANGFIDDIYGFNFITNKGESMDDNGHGTHCAGVIGAAHNGQGIMGVMAYVKLVALKFLDHDGNGEVINAIKAIDYGIKRGVKIMSNSWGGDGYNRALEDAITAAAHAGVTFVTAAGNDATDNDRVEYFPANYKVENVISVGSFNSYGKISYFSNFGLKSVHVLAPGSRVLSTVIHNQFELMSGTSMAAPHVAGIVGLLLSKEPLLTPPQIRDRLILTSVKSHDLQTFSVSGGRVDAFRTLQNISTQP